MTTRTTRSSDFDDPSADTRTAVVTMTVDEGAGALGPEDGPVSFRVLVPSQADPDRFAESMAGLGRIAVVLHRDPNDFDSTPWRPLMNDNLIGVIADDGSLTLPGLARGTEFAGDIHTAAQLLDGGPGAGDDHDPRHPLIQPAQERSRPGRLGRGTMSS